MHQYTSADGLHPVLPPSWVLGLHICRDTAKDNETLAAEDALYFIKEAMATGLPYESDCLQEGLLYQMSFTIPESMEHVIEEIQRMQRRILLSLPPHVNSSLVTIDELFVLTEDQQVLSQEYHSLNVSYPDFFNEVTGTWFRENLNNLMTGREDVVGGFVLQDNWPAVNTTEDKTENMVYVPEGTLSRGTLWWEVRHGSTPHYKLHNKYSLQNAKSVASSLQLEKHLVLTAATYTGSGTVGGSHAHTQADVACTWSNMKDALEMALGQGLAGIPLAGGGSVCGTTGSYDDELCIRWYLMSSMLPLMRVSSEMPLRDPVNLKFGYAREAVKRALALRYSLLAYFYSLFHNASSEGVPIARPMFFDFPSDNKTWTENEQFMVGPALLVRPAFYKNAVSVPVYLPNENTTWYHFGGGHKVNNGTGEVTVGVTSLDKELVLLLRGGFIVPVQKAKPTVSETLSGPYNLVVGLKCNENGTCSAFGDLTVDSNIKFTFSATERELSFQSVCVNTTSSSTLENISVYGLNMTACLNVSSSFNTGASCAVAEGNQILEITDLQLDLCSKGDGQIHWEVTDIPQSTTTIKPETSTINPETTTKPKTTEPETTEPKTTEPETTEPKTTEPETTETETTN
ncbi:Lysosomal alpha-glucosidase [Zootermopsis nevadensis]|uniref:Lysosomal alpha-glucosidase n=2 Tax=Zootermopsis nevadensis TaxID=136037 RepID=A0A067QQ29_ZOONE|nr:Lysosomal alpha-glucosidase [Zootermopsis nevadensis]